MSKLDNYGGASHDPALDGGEVYDWNPVDHIAADDDDADWSSTYGDPTGWSENTVTALVFRVQVPAHDAEGNATDQPFVIPKQYLGKTEVFVARCAYDWGHTCDGITEACAPDATFEQAQMGARNLCDGPLSGCEGVMTCEDHWIPGNPEFIFDDSDEENKVVYLRYWRPGAVEPYESEAIGFDNDPAAAILEYVNRMGWLEQAPNQDAPAPDYSPS
jgi:hypothetical protein